MKLPGLILFIISCTGFLYGQSSSFDSFLSRLSEKYEVDVAIAPELIPVLDSIKYFGPEVTSVEHFLELLLQDKNISYQVIDGNKVLLRKETSVGSHEGHILISGTIVDKRDHTPLAFSAVSVLNTPHGTYTDEDGKFTLYADKSASALQINYLGFKPVIIPIDDLKNAGGKVEMEVDHVPLEQVVIIVPFHHIATGDESMDLKGYQFISSEDFLYWNSERLITQLTGYTHNSTEEGIRIRSSDEQNSLVMMDGIPVSDPYHFYNIFSPFNGYYFPTVNLYKNNMPVEYGGRIDGLIELNSSTNENGSNILFDSDLLLTSVAAEVDISDKIKMTAGGRVSHTSLLYASVRDSTSANFTNPGRFRDENEWTSSQEPRFNFYDINLGLKVEPGKKNEISLAYFHNKDYLENSISTEFSTTIQDHEVLSVEQKIKSRDDWENSGFSAGFKTRLNDDTHFQLTGFLSSFEKNITYNALTKEKIPKKPPRISINTGFQNSVLQSVGFKALINKASPEKKGFSLGVDYQQHQIDLVAKENTTPYLLEVQEENEATLFGEYNLPIDVKLNIAVGGRLTYLSSTSNVYVQPNVRLQYLIHENWKLKSAFSKNIQVVRELTVENRFGREVEFLSLSQPDAGYPVLKSDKYMIGAGFTSDKLSLDGELYYKKTNGLISVRAPRPDPSFMDATSPGEFYRLYIGDGWTAGLDLIAIYKLKNSETSLSYTLSKISQQFDQLFNGEEFSPTEDRRHQVKLTSQYKIGPFIASGLINYKTEASYIRLVRLDGGGIGMVEHETVEDDLPAYFSLDLALDYSFRIANQTALLGASIINVTDHENINDIQHVGRIPRGAGKELFLTNETELLGRTFNVHIRLLLN